MSFVVKIILLAVGIFLFVFGFFVVGSIVLCKGCLRSTK